MSKTIVGLIISLPGQVVDRILHGRTIYAGPSQEGVTQLGVGDRVFFYDIKSGILIAEAKIAKITSESSDEVIRYGAKLFLSKDEFKKYLADMGQTSGNALLVMELEEVTEYTRPVKCPFPVPATGKYLTEATLREIVRTNM